MLLLARLTVTSLQYDVFVNGKNVGSAEVSQSVQPNGNIQGSFIIRLNKPTPGTFSAVTLQDRTGRMLRKTMITKTPANSAGLDFVYGQTVKVDVSGNGKHITKILSIPKGASLQNQSTLWFLTTTPHRGANCDYMDVSSTDMKWRKVHASYPGDEKLAWKGKSIMTHKVIFSDSTSWIDSRGYPYKTVFGKGKAAMIILRK